MAENRRKIKKVIGGLKKASRLHAGQAKVLSSVLASKSKKRKKSNAKK